MKINYLTFNIPYANRWGRAKHSYISGIFAPDRLGNFFMSDLVGSAENTTGILLNNLAHSYVACLAPDTLRFKETSKQGHKKMTNITDIQGVYDELRRILNIINKQPYSAENDDAEDALCTAINALESAIAYLPTEGKADRKIKLDLLKKTITEIAEDGDGNIDLDKLTPRAREQLAMVLELVKE